DPLTGCKNFLGFLETCLNLSRSEVHATAMEHSQCAAVLFIDMNGLGSLNESKGRAYGDSVIHWMGILLREESDSAVFRLGGDEFAVS
ncbi:MAG: diguanylate cyclase, partial [Chloroflexota bacterium]